MGSPARLIHTLMFLFCLPLAVKGMTSPQPLAATDEPTSETTRTAVQKISTTTAVANEVSLETNEISTHYSLPEESSGLATASVSTDMETTLPRSESFTTASTAPTSDVMISRRTSTSSTNHRTTSRPSMVPSTTRKTVSTTKTMFPTTRTTVSTQSTENAKSTWTRSKPQTATKGVITTTESPRRPTPQVLSESCPKDYVVMGQGSKCTCTTSDLGSPPGKLMWVDPLGAVVAEGEEHELDLDFSLVTEAYNRREYKCVLRHRFWDWNILYTPQIANRPDNPKILGFQKSYQAKEEIRLQCVVGGGIPDVKTVSFECTGHPDKPDTALHDGTVASNQSFIASASDNSTQCVCKGTNDVLQSRENIITVLVAAIQQPDADESLEDDITVEVIAAAVSAIFTLVPSVFLFLYRKRIRSMCQKRFGWCKDTDEEEKDEIRSQTPYIVVEPKNTNSPYKSDSLYAKQLQKQLDRERALSRMGRETRSRPDTYDSDENFARRIQDAEIKKYQEQDDEEIARAVQHSELSDILFVFS